MFLQGGLVYVKVIFFVLFEEARVAKGALEGPPSEQKNSEQGNGLRRAQLEILN